MSEAVEAIKISLKQEADGIIVAFRIHPDDLPTDLLRARINSRFALAFQQIGDDEKPVPASPVMKAVEKKKKQNANVMRAAIACGEPKFSHFLKQKYPDRWKVLVGSNRDRAAAMIRFLTDIESRRDLATNAEALGKFDRVMAEYEMWKRGQ